MICLVQAKKRTLERKLYFDSVPTKKAVFGSIFSSQYSIVDNSATTERISTKLGMQTRMASEIDKFEY
jgi:hypothetical protein